MSELFPPTIDDAIAELKRELGMREHVYPRLVSQRKLKSEDAGRRNARLMMAIQLLEEMNEDVE